MQKLKNSQLNRIGTEVFKAADKLPVVIVLDNVRSALNVGSVFRTADAFLVKKIYLCGITAAPPHKDILKTALGATSTVAWEYAESTSGLLGELKKEGYRIFAVEQAVESISLVQFNPFNSGDSPVAIVFGHEIDGVSDKALDLCHGCIEVPQYGTKHSLNIAVCAGIVIWDIFMKYKSKSIASEPG